MCGYALEGLADEAACPECGAPAGDSRHGGLLGSAPAAYVRGLARGALVAEVGALLQLAMAWVQIGAAYLWNDTSQLTSLSAIRAQVVAQYRVQIVLGVLWALVLGVGLVGWWLVVRPDPRFRSRDVAWGPRVVVRAAVVVLMTVFVLVPVQRGVELGMVLERTSAGANWMAAMRWMVSSAVFVQLFGVFAWLVAIVSIALYVRQLAARLGDRRLLARASRLVWLMPLLVVLQLVLDLSIGGLGWAQVAVSLATSVAWFVLWVGMVDRLRRGLAGAVRG